MALYWDRIEIPHATKIVAYRATVKIISKMIRLTQWTGFSVLGCPENWGPIGLIVDHKGVK